MCFLYALPYRPQVAQEVYIDENGLIPGMGQSVVVKEPHSNTLRNFDWQMRTAAVNATAQISGYVTLLPYTTLHRYRRTK